MQHKLTIGPKIMQNNPTNLKFKGPTGIFAENRDIKTVVREPFANDLAPSELSL